MLVFLVGPEWEIGQVRERRDTHVKIMNVHQKYIFCDLQEIWETENPVNNTTRLI